MLKQRVITAILMMLVFLGALVYLPVPLFALFVAAVVLIAAWEWANLAGLGRVWQRSLYLSATAIVLGLAGRYLTIPELLHAPLSNDQALAFRNLLVVACGWWALSLLWVQTYPQSALLWNSWPVRALMGFFVLVPAWAGLVYVRSYEHGVGLVLLLVAVVACADIGAYFCGRRWGRAKLAPAVSPGKTWEGFIGGLAVNLVLTLVVWLIWGGSYWLLLALVLPTALVSVLGDLQESMLKRHRGVKDSSALLPGHGGFLDRLDSLTAAAPVFALALLISGWVPA